MNVADNSQAEKRNRAGLLIADIAGSVRPRESVLKLGSGRMAIPELLAILLCVGWDGESAVKIAQYVLTEIGGMTGLETIDADRVCAIRGIRQLKAEQLMAAAKLGKRMARRLAHGCLRYLASSLKAVAVTRIIDEAGKLLGTNVLDPLVIRRRKYVLLRYRRLGFYAA